LELEYVVTRTGDPSEAEIRQSGELVARLDKMKGDLRTLLKLENPPKRMFYLDPKVDGSIAAFSTVVYDDSGKTWLKIKSGVLSYNGKIYLFKSLPEGKSMSGHLLGMKFISRMDNLPFHDVDEIDRQTREKLIKHRGMEVGRLSGLGSLGHKVVLSDELKDIGLPLAAASYLLYSTG
jgi:hypothetical protein